jgi:hypothetical protein
MNIDERLQALTETVEILAGMQRENEKRFAEIARDLQQVSRNFETVHDSLVRLERIAVAHEERLDDLEGQ